MPESRTTQEVHSQVSKELGGQALQAEARLMAPDIRRMPQPSERAPQQSSGGAVRVDASAQQQLHQAQAAAAPTVSGKQRTIPKTEKLLRRDIESRIEAEMRSTDKEIRKISSDPSQARRLYSLWQYLRQLKGFWRGISVMTKQALTDLWTRFNKGESTKDVITSEL